jgi:hypothetical protein
LAVWVILVFIASFWGGVGEFWGLGVLGIYILIKLIKWGWDFFWGGESEERGEVDSVDSVWGLIRVLNFGNR